MANVSKLTCCFSRGVLGGTFKKRKWDTCWFRVVIIDHRYWRRDPEVFLMGIPNLPKCGVPVSSSNRTI